MNQNIIEKSGSSPKYQNKNVGIFSGVQEVNNAHSNSGRTDFPFPSIQEDSSSKHELHIQIYIYIYIYYKIISNSHNFEELIMNIHSS